jgi:hypothetical protein
VRAARAGLLVLVLMLCGVFARPARAQQADPAALAIVESPALEVDPAYAHAVTAQLYATAMGRGYRVVPGALTAELAARIGPRPPLPGDLYGLAVAARAGHALSAALVLQGNRFVVRLTIANTDGTGPYSVADGADAASLAATVDRLASALLPPRTPSPPPAVPPLASPPPERAGSSAAGTDAPPRHAVHRLALSAETAFGLSNPSFVNELVGARFDYGFTRDVALGTYLGYANLKGRNGRSGNVLPYFQIEYRLHGANSDGFAIPLRFGTGYLPRNGPFARLSAGLSFPLGEKAHLGLDLIAPAVWIVHNRTVYSMNVAAEVAFDL